MTSAARLLSGLVPLTLVGCGLTDDPPVDPPVDDTVVFTARLNGEPWTGEGPRSAFFLGNDLSVSATDPDEARYPYEHHVVFVIPFESVGEYALTHWVTSDNPGTDDEVSHLYGAIFSESYGDQVNSEYHATQDPANRLVVTRYDGVNGHVRGDARRRPQFGVPRTSRHAPSHGRPVPRPRRGRPGG